MKRGSGGFVSLTKNVYSLVVEPPRGFGMARERGNQIDAVLHPAAGARAGIVELPAVQT